MLYFNLFCIQTICLSFALSKRFFSIFSNFVENSPIHIQLCQQKCSFWNQVSLSNAINQIHLWPKFCLYYKVRGLLPELFSVRIIILNVQSSCLIHSIISFCHPLPHFCCYIKICCYPTLLVHCNKIRSHLL